MKMREAHQGDLPAILEIYNETIRTLTASFNEHEKDLEDRRKWLDAHQEQFVVLVAENDQQEIVGYTTLSPHHQEDGYLYTAELSIYLSSAFRKQGYGKKMMEQTINIAEERGFHTIISSITDGNEGSVRLHELFGFEHVGTFKQVGYKFDEWLDVVYYQKILGKNN
ncbi:GNAT family N-acetyltransferase [Halalkalibacillus halophilus]|uniref:GNAT family N-acetyltransferase n=1 Tax=Halalkalibacillus halophilus TaxID=392827 RepID=UPI0003F9D25A|nr:GNAT family N-acetyltransferase [Halalkalibacillus halophilus]